MATLWTPRLATGQDGREGFPRRAMLIKGGVFK